VKFRHRLEAIQKLSSYEAHTAAGNILFPGEEVKKRVKSKIKENIGARYSKEIDIGDDAPMRQWMPK
jgi:uncharacterized protein (DUF1697 family)